MSFIKISKVDDYNDTPVNERHIEIDILKREVEEDGEEIDRCDNEGEFNMNLHWRPEGYGPRINYGRYLLFQLTISDIRISYYTKCHYHGNDEEI